MKKYHQMIEYSDDYIVSHHLYQVVIRKNVSFFYIPSTIHLCVDTKMPKIVSKQQDQPN